MIAGMASQNILQAGPLPEVELSKPMGANSSDVAEFKNALGGCPSVLQQNTNSVEPPQIGQQIIKGIDAMNHNFESRVADLQHAIDSSKGKDLSISDMLGIQSKLALLSISEGMTTKIAEKSTSTVEQLFKTS